MLRDESGLTLAELMVSLAILSFMVGLAVLSGSSTLRAAHLSQATSQLANDLAVARMSAIARSETWRVRFLPPVVGSTVINQYVVESRIPNGSWLQQGEDRKLAYGLGMAVPFESGEPVSLQFNRFGRFGRDVDTEIPICRIQTNLDSTQECQPDSVGRTIRIYANTGVMEY